MLDNNGREYFKLADAKLGMYVELDNGFDCMVAGPTRLYIGRNGKLFFKCRDGSHYLEAQATDGVHCVGVYSCG